MRTVVIRDDDTNALTPPEYLERLYRPFLARGLPVNLAVIPEVKTSVLRPDGRREGFISAGLGGEGPTVPIAKNRQLVEYLRTNRGYHVAQHGCHHDYFEFDLADRAEVIRRLALGERRLQEAGFAPARAFVAPYDRFSRVGLELTARRFDVVSTGWFEWRRVPPKWWPRYVWHKARRGHHWQVGPSLLLRHPGCILSCERSYDSMFEKVKAAVASQPLTVIVTHWWEYFRDRQPDDPFIAVLHRVGQWLADSPDINVVPFADLRPAHLR